jgi:hypothetical protein
MRINMRIVTHIRQQAKASVEVGLFVPARDQANRGNSFVRKTVDGGQESAERAFPNLHNKL